MGKFERQFTASMAGAIPAGVSAYERFAEKAAQDKRYAKEAERQSEQDKIQKAQLERQARMDILSENESRLRTGGYNPADISAAAEQRALLGEPELANLQSTMAKGETGIPSKYASNKYNLKAENALQGFEGFMQGKSRGKTFEQEQELIRLRGEEARKTGNRKSPRDYSISELTNQIKVLGSQGYPVQDLVDELRKKQSLTIPVEPFRAQKFFESDTAYAKAKSEAEKINKPESDSMGLYP